MPLIVMSTVLLFQSSHFLDYQGDGSFLDSLVGSSVVKKHPCLGRQARSNSSYEYMVGKMLACNSQLGFVLFVIGCESGAGFVNR